MKAQQLDLFQNKDERSLLTQLLDESRLYKEGKVVVSNKFSLGLTLCLLTRIG
jgi:hypothetical protein